VKLNGFKGTVCTDVELNRYTTWGIGGKADMIIMPSSISDLKIALHELSKYNLPRFVLGNGSNVLFSDKGFRGAVFILGAGFKHIAIDGSTVTAGAGVMLHYLAQKTAAAGLSGLEELAGIPGTVGGAAFSNAGAHGRSFLSMCNAIHGLDSSAKEVTLTSIHSGYRSSGLHDDFVITDINLKMTISSPSEIHELTTKYLEKRRSTQPLSEASAGCTFKNPDKRGAGRLIDTLGLKGFQKGQAMISGKHANFIINTGRAKASDIVGLIEHVRLKVWDAYGVKLELEVCIIDEFGKPLDPGRIP
jgi:UDP-N-acetylmuramate dehydrogenase